MTRIVKLKNVKTTVENMLLVSPISRDSDDKLVCNIWYKILTKERIDSMSAMDLLQVISDGTLPSYDNISRARRKLQEENPHLRGKNYKERHQEEKDVRTNIHDL